MIDDREERIGKELLCSIAIRLNDRWTEGKANVLLFDKAVLCLSEEAKEKEEQLFSKITRCFA